MEAKMLDEEFEAGYRRAWDDLRARVKAVYMLDEATFAQALRDQRALRPVDAVPPPLRGRPLPGKIVAWDGNTWWGVILLDVLPLHLKLNFHGTCVGGGPRDSMHLDQPVEVVTGHNGCVLRVNLR